MSTFIAPAILSAVFVFIFGFALGHSWEFGWQLSIGVTVSLFVAVLSLVTTVHHSYAVRRHNKLQVKPQLVIESYLDGTIKEDFLIYTLSLKNVGLGPAIISRYSVNLGNTKIEDSDSVFIEFLKLVNNSTHAKGRSITEARYLEEGEALDKGQEKILFKTQIPKDDLTFMKGREILKKLAKEIQISIKYRCHYGMDFEVGRGNKNA
ncbi:MULTISPECIES: hypothetical protein [Giesbergeria]|uniref:Uncharacterized protein n=1 Tax=Giesbergeria sinuosa TaxID=80883 RepID=A0ABV9QFP8_9BURK